MTRTPDGASDIEEMPGLVDAADFGHGAAVDLIDAGWLLAKAPVVGQGQIGELQQKGAIDAVMRDNSNGLAGMLAKQFPHPFRRPRRKVLQAVAIGKAHQMRRQMPGHVEIAAAFAHVGMGLSVPVAIIEVDEVPASRGRRPCCGGNGGAGRNASPQRAGEDGINGPFGMDARCRGGGLPLAQECQRHVRAPAKPLRLDAVDMTMPHQNELHIPPFRTGRATTACASASYEARLLADNRNRRGPQAIGGTEVSAQSKMPLLCFST